MTFTDYVYRNADDTRRVRILQRENGRWVFDVFHRGGSIETSSDHGEDYRRKSDAKRAAIDAIGPLVAIQVSKVRAGWDSLDGKAAGVGATLDGKAAGVGATLDGKAAGVGAALNLLDRKFP